MPSNRDLLDVVRRDPSSLPDGATLAGLAARAGWSPFHLHRAFRAMVRETPKQYTLRLQLQQAATRLVSSDDSVLDVALGVRLQQSRSLHARVPSLLRCDADGLSRTGARGCVGRHSRAPCRARAHIGAVFRSLPRSCVFTLGDLRCPRCRLSAARSQRSTSCSSAFAPAATRLSNAIGEGLGKAFPYSQRLGLAIAGRPFTRYLSTGPGLFSIEVGMPVATAPQGEGVVEAGTLPAGPVAVAMHAGPVRSAQRNLRCAGTLDRVERLPHWRRTVGVLHHRPGRSPRSCGLENRGVLAAGEIAPSRSSSSRPWL